MTRVVLTQLTNVGIQASDTGVGKKDDEEGNEEPVYVSLSQMQAKFEAQTAKTDAAAQERFPPRTS
ncbi:MAG: hypothetical protein ACE5GN_06155 [Waddliaceae bacterium]